MTRTRARFRSASSRPTGVGHRLKTGQPPTPSGRAEGSSRSRGTRAALLCPVCLRLQHDCLSHVAMLAPVFLTNGRTQAAAGTGRCGTRCWRRLHTDRHSSVGFCGGKGKPTRKACIAPAHTRCFTLLRGPTAAAAKPLLLRTLHTAAAATAVPVPGHDRRMASGFPAAGRVLRVHPAVDLVSNRRAWPRTAADARGAASGRGTAAWCWLGDSC